MLYEPYSAPLDYTPWRNLSNVEERYESYRGILDLTVQNQAIIQSLHILTAASIAFFICFALDRFFPR